MGLDINATAVSYVRDELHIDDVYVANVIESGLPPELADQHWDLIVMGEIIEHLPDPVGFMAALRAAVPAAALLVTGPNAWCIPTLLQALRGTEMINTDHQAWYTPFTMAKQLTRAGYAPLGWSACSGYPLAKHRFLARSLRRCFPLMRTSLVMLAQSAA